ncbi:ATPase P [Desulfonema ishimotonii]|uniref:ATPase P n=1 Tax=Desulfonema ishimotonii TaxID=45657 RepID=A0A401G0K1_9BACT|nr:HAD family hydrolase [Desulfonema ishimotonii]GBC62748.1 ATPase P [Desulfonema ishimotonii]
MIETAIPGYGTVRIDHIVLDYNGTLAVDGELLPGVRSALNTLAENIGVHVLTADTFGKAASRLEGVRCRLSVLPPGDQDAGKRDYVRQLGADRTACVGNGRNDRLMLETSALGIAVILGEGAAAETVRAADIVCTDIVAALELLTHPLRLTATLRA